MSKMTSGSLESRVSKLVFNYRLTHHASTGCPPTEFLMSCWPRSLLDVLRPLLTKVVRQIQEKQMVQHDTHACQQSLEAGNSVLVHDFACNHPTSTWTSGRIVERRRSTIRPEVLYHTPFTSQITEWFAVTSIIFVKALRLKLTQVLLPWMTYIQNF